MKLNKRKIALDFMKGTCGADVLSPEAWNILKNVEERELAKALILKWRKDGLTLGQLVIKSGLSQRQVKYIINGVPKGT